MPRRTRAEMQEALELERINQRDQWQREWGPYLNRLTTRMEQKYAERNRRILEVYNRRFLLRKPPLPETFKATQADLRFPFVNDVLRRAAAVVGQNPPRSHVNPAKGKLNQKNADLRENWWEAARKRMFEGKHTWGKITDALPSDGMAVWKILRDEHEFGVVMRREGEDAKSFNARAEESRRENFPIQWEFVPSVSYMPVSETAVLEITTREFLPVALHFGLSIDHEGKIGFGRVGEIVGRPSVYPGTQNTTNYPDTVKVTEYWDGEHYVYMVRDFVVRVGTHDYGRPPYFEVPFAVTASMAPEDNGLSLAYAMLSLQDNMDDLATRKMAWTFLASFPGMDAEPLFEDTPPLPDGTVLKWEAGKHPYAAGHKVSWKMPPPVGQDLNDLMVMLKDILDTIGIAPILQGIPVGANTSNAAVQSMVAVARSVFGPGMQNLAQALDESAKFVMQLVEKGGQKIPVWHKGLDEWLELGPDDIDGYYEFEHKLEPMIPAERMSKMMVTADLQSRKLMSRRRAMEEGEGIEDPTREIDDIYVEGLDDDPTLKQMEIGQIAAQIQADPRFIQPGTPENASAGAGGSGVPVVAGLQQELQPGMGVPERPPGIGRNNS
ncbi:hypothetical protein LCGC14_1980370 [marine sediment metagenome]|uniref:Portal protein n=1 Tax=marine sediment metagenome TaxID=412755 RepID=A0A0F9F928_9ZZZZ